MPSKLSYEVRVYETTEYDKFKRPTGQRDLDERHIRKLIQDQTAGNFNITQIEPIVVNELNEIIDGMHRLNANKRLGWPVFYEVREGLTVSYARAKNSGHKSWTWRDYAVSFKAEGNENYSKFLELANEYKTVRFTTLLEFLAGSNDAPFHVRLFREGRLNIKDLAKARQLLDEYVEWVDVAGDDARAFARASKKILVRENYNHEHMLSRLAKYSAKLRVCYFTNDYVSALEEIYNASLPVEERI